MTTQTQAFPLNGAETEDMQMPPLASPSPQTRSVPLTRVEVPDYSLGLRGKFMRRDAAQAGAAARFCTIVYGLSLTDAVADNSFSSSQIGYPDRPLAFDESTRVDLPWQPNMEAVIADLVEVDGSPFGASPRGTLKKVLDRYEARGLTPVLGYEFEFWVFHDTDRTRPSGTTEALGRQTNAYNMQRIAAAREVIGEFMWRMGQIGVHVEAFHSELGPGLFEFTLAPETALQAADNAVRAKQYMRELCAEHGLAASFMAKPFGMESGAGGHAHSSLMRHGENIFAEEPGKMSATGQHYLAGLIATMPDFTALFAPYINSYKRIDPSQFVADRASWALDNRGSSCRLLLGSLPAARVEHRVPGADTSPYFSALGILAGGIHGIERELALEDVTRQAQSLPTELTEATQVFQESAVAREMLGDMLIEGVTKMQEAEARDYAQWLRANITDWERARHLEHH